MDTGHTPGMKRYNIDESAEPQRTVKKLRSSFELVKAKTGFLTMRR
jgi:hypothetical protein